MQVTFSVSSEAQFLSSLSNLVLTFHNFLLQKRFRGSFKLGGFWWWLPSGDLYNLIYTEDAQVVIAGVF